MDSLRDDLFAVLASAERAAAEIRRDAEAEASERTAELARRGDELATARASEIAALGEELAAQAGTMRQHSNDLIRALEEQTEQVESAYAEMIEALATASSRLAEHGRPTPTELTLSQRREVSFHVPRRAATPAAEEPQR